MTTLNPATGELLDAPTYGDVKASIEKAKASLEAAAEQIVWQIENQAWAVLGYVDWNEMREAEYGGAAFMVPRAERPELVARMRRQGLTQKEIADTAGVDAATVSRDLANASSEDEPASITNARGQQRPASYTKTPQGEVAPDSEQRMAPIEGSREGVVDTPRPAADHVAEAVAEFPDLAYYADLGQDRDVLNMAGDLRRYRARGELDERLDTLRRSIALDRSKRDGTYQPQPMPVAVCPTCGQTVRN